MALSEIRILLRYYYSPDDDEEMSENTAAWRVSIRNLLEAELLVQTPGGSRAYDVTERGRVYCEAIRAVPLPVHMWVIPPVGEQGR